MVIVELRYMPYIDALLLLMWQVSITFIRAVKKGTIIAFLHFILALVIKYPSNVCHKRKPIERRLMRKWYALRLNDRCRSDKYTSVGAFRYYALLIQRHSKETE